MQCVLQYSNKETHRETVLEKKINVEGESAITTHELLQLMMPPALRKPFHMIFAETLQNSL